MITSVDQMGVAHRFETRPRRIISLVPSITELICDLGLRDHLVGCTKFCVHPSDLRKAITSVGGTKNLKLSSIHNLDPDLIIANKEENTQDQVEELNKSYSVWISDVSDISDMYELIHSLGQLLDTSKSASFITQSLKSILSPNARRLGRAVYLIWRHPYMTVGGDTFISSMMTQVGFENVFADDIRYPEVTLDQIADCKPDYVLLSSEPFPFKEKHLTEVRALLPETNVQLVDGEFFSWYGSRQTHLRDYMKQWR